MFWYFRCCEFFRHGPQNTLQHFSCWRGWQRGQKAHFCRYFAVRQPLLQVLLSCSRIERAGTSSFNKGNNLFVMFHRAAHDCRLNNILVGIDRLPHFDRIANFP